MLYKAVTRADAEVQKAIHTAIATRWRIVADEMKAMKVRLWSAPFNIANLSEPVVNFSQNACQDRYEALENGTAKPTPESFDDPDAKTLERIKCSP